MGVVGLDVDVEVCILLVVSIGWLDFSDCGMFLFCVIIVCI